MNKLFKTVTDSSADPYFQNEKQPYTRLIVRDLKLDMFIGVFDHEKEKPQPVIVNVETTVDYDPSENTDSIDDVLSYAGIVDAVKRIAERGHINLVETFADYIADFCLQNKRVIDIRVRIEKPDAFEDAKSVGVEIFRQRV